MCGTFSSRMSIAALLVRVSAVLAQAVPSRPLQAQQPQELAQAQAVLLPQYKRRKKTRGKRAAVAQRLTLSNLTSHPTKLNCRAAIVALARNTSRVNERTSEQLSQPPGLRRCSSPCCVTLFSALYACGRYAIGLPWVTAGGVGGWEAGGTFRSSKQDKDE